MELDEMQDVIKTLRNAAINFPQDMTPSSMYGQYMRAADLLEKLSSSNSNQVQPSWMADRVTKAANVLVEEVTGILELMLRYEDKVDKLAEAEKKLKQRTADYRMALNTVKSLAIAGNHKASEKYAHAQLLLLDAEESAAGG